MFGLKQDRMKELEEQLAECQAQLQQKDEKIRQIENAGNDCEQCFATQIAAESEMDKQLTKVVSNTYDTIAANDALRESVEQLALDLTHMRGQMEETEQGGSNWKDVIEKQKEKLEAVVEENKRFTEPVKFLQQVQIDIAKEIGEAERELVKMREYAKQMSILALNCAIEAGRMGDGSRSFIGAAEDIRSFSVAYDQSASDVQSQIIHMRDSMDKLQKQAAYLTKYLKDNNVAMAHLTKDFTQCVQEADETENILFSDKVYALSEKVREISQGQGTIAELQKQTLDEMENIGTSFIDEQNARKEVERILDQMRESMRNNNE